MRKRKRRRYYAAVTLVDFGDRNRRHVLMRHYSLAAAFRAHRRWWDIYCRLHKSRIWIEDVVHEEPRLGPADNF